MSIAERTSNFCLVRKLTWPLVSSDIFTQWGWLIPFCPEFSQAIQRRWKSVNLSLPQPLSSRTDVFLSASSIAAVSLHYKESLIIHGPLSFTLLDQRFPVEHELNEYITPSTNSNNWQHAKCLHHGPGIYDEYIFHCFRTSNYWQLAKLPARPFYTCFLSHYDEQRKG